MFDWISDLFGWLIDIVMSIINFIWEFIKEYWWVILLVAAIYFAPAIAGALGSMGAPSFVTAIFSGIGEFVTPLLSDILGGVGSAISSVASSGWSAFSEASLGTQLSIALGAATLLAPESTAEFLGDTATAVGGIFGSVVDSVINAVGSVVSGFISNPAGLAVLAFGVYWFFLRDDDEGVAT